MLITTCTHCLARFRVTPQQLNLKQGQVRCGHCQKVFSGFEALERFPDDDTGSRILAARSAAAASPQALAPKVPAVPLPPSLPDPLEALEPIEPLEDPPHLDPLDDTPVPAGDDGGPIVAPEAPGKDEAQLQPAQDAGGEAPRAVPYPDAMASLAAQYAPPAPAAGVSRAWAFAAVLLVVLLGLQLAYAYRAQLAQAYPAARPWLESVCAQVGCFVPWVNDHALLKLEDSELLEVPGKPGEIALSARIRNLAPSAQEFPHLELTLSDLSGQAASRRVLRPADYLGREPAVGEVMAAGTEFAIQLRLETPRIKPTGYELLLFYP